MVLEFVWGCFPFSHVLIYLQVFCFATVAASTLLYLEFLFLWFAGYCIFFNCVLSLIYSLLCENIVESFQCKKLFTVLEEPKALFLRRDSLWLGGA